MHACGLRDVLRDVGAGGISGDPEKLVRRFDEVFARPGTAERVMRLGAGAARYPLPGPSRPELLAAIGA